MNAIFAAATEFRRRIAKSVSAATPSAFGARRRPQGRQYSVFFWRGAAQWRRGGDRDHGQMVRTITAADDGFIAWRGIPATVERQQQGVGGSRRAMSCMAGGKRRQHLVGHRHDDFRRRNDAFILPYAGIGQRRLFAAGLPSVFRLHGGLGLPPLCLGRAGLFRQGDICCFHLLSTVSQRLRRLAGRRLTVDFQRHLLAGLMRCDQLCTTA